MFARFSRTCFLPVLLIAATAIFPCRGLATIVISRKFDLPIPSPDDPDSEYKKGRMADAIIDIPEHLSISDLDIAISLTHESFYDLQIMLEGPEGTVITLNPHSNDAFITRGPDGRLVPVGGSNRFLFDDESAIPIEEAVQPWNQPFKPADGFTLSVFDGRDVFGRWRLQIIDACMDHAGRLHEVELIINTPEPGTLWLFGLAGAIARLLNNHRKR
jgi:hypothetical protein